MLTDDDLYRHGTQFRVWSFAGADLVARREAINARGITKLRRTHSSEVLANVEFLTAAEELDLVVYYCYKAQDLAAVFKFPTVVKATAISYLKKFYLRFSVMDYHPKDVMYTCLFLSSKAENHFISIEKFVEPLQKVTSAALIDLEYVVIQALSFTLLVHHPFDPIHGFFLDMQSAFAADKVADLGALHDAARRHANNALFSDASFLYSPPHIALAAMALANQDLVTDYIRIKFKSSPQIESQIITEIDLIKPLILAGANQPSRDRMIAIDKKLYYCRNPEKLTKRKVVSAEVDSRSDDQKRIKIET
ncbi:cyclin-like protein [Lipomyces japonicus]|uniref:cyclin-like protein n=1 Tax=Lipomyces japonicus TaxID=56871 RepID=UPI0034CEB840